MNETGTSTTGNKHLDNALAQLLLRGDNCNNPERTGISPALQLLVFFVCAAIVVSHRPDALFNPQFFGEDGTIWYPEAYMSGWFAALFHSRNGYFQTIPRLTAAIALLFPFRFAPLVENLLGIVIQVLPVNFLLSERCRSWGPLLTRILLGFFYLVLPNTRELDVAPEEAQWHLALLACMVVLSCPPRNWKWRVFDTVTVLVSGLSGPFGVILTPIALIFWWFRRLRWRLFISAVLAVTAIIQLLPLITLAQATRSHAALGATPGLFVRLLGGQVYLGALLGHTGFQVQRPLLHLAMAALLGTVVAGYCFWKARIEWKLFLIFCGLIFAASLKNPMVSAVVPQWQTLKIAAGIRYWFFPMIGFVWALAWCATLAGSGFFRFAGTAGLLMAIIGIVADWRYLPYTDAHFAKYAAQFTAAPPGNMINIPIFPDGWTMKLVKKNPACHGLLLGSVDRPKPNADVSSPIAIAGWVAADQPVRRVIIYVDRTLLQTITPDVRRPDVDSYYPQSPDRFKGWGGTIDLSRVSPGPHEIEVRAVEDNGCEEDFGVIPVGVRRGK